MKIIWINIFMLLNIVVFAQNQYFTYFNKTHGGNDTINILIGSAQPLEDGYLVFGKYSTPEYRSLCAIKINSIGDIISWKDFEIGHSANNLGIIEQHECHLWSILCGIN